MVKDVHNPPTNRQLYTVEYAYDHQGRMVWKTVSTNSAVISTRTLLWDNYNIIAETIHSTIPSFQSSTNLYVWGLDLSGTLQGAGGVGGLLAVTTVSNPGTLEPLNPETFFPCFDANGNVTEYTDDSGSIAAHYEYSPFGETVVQSGPMADGFTHRFSTKPWCDITGLSEYLFRKYSPGMGRWLSRDPIGEYGGLNLFGLVLNNPVAHFDRLGLSCSWAVGFCQRAVAVPHFIDVPVYGKVDMWSLLGSVLLHQSVQIASYPTTDCSGPADFTETRSFHETIKWSSLLHYYLWILSAGFLHDGWVPGKVSDEEFPGTCRLVCQKTKDRFDTVKKRIETSPANRYHLLKYTCNDWADEQLQ